MSEVFDYRDGELYVEDVPVAALAEQFGTPLYVYSRQHLRDQLAALRSALGELQPHFFYAVKANTSAAVINLFAREGTGADVVSGGELFRALRAGIPAAKIVFAGVGKTTEEIEYALREDICFFTVESEPELERISQIAQRLHRRGRIALRVNPDVDPRTHHYTSTGKKESKFGVDLERALRAYDQAASLPNLDIVGLHMHLGSPIMSVDPYAQALAKAAPVCAQLKAQYPAFRWLDLGGGLGIPYKPDQAPFDLEDFARTLVPALKPLGLEVGLEPGRFLTGNGAILVGRVQYIKDNPFKKFVITDIGMNDLIRPALYQAWHEIVAVRHTERRILGDVVGPICESGDFQATERELPEVQPGDLLAVMSAGAYGFAMASTYNSRGRAAEVMVSGTRIELIRARESWEDLVRGERIPDWS